MKKEINRKSTNDDLRPEYDFANMKGGVEGKYVDDFKAGTNLVLLDPDVYQVFPTEKAVNDALRLLMETAERVGNPLGGKNDAKDIQ